MASKTRRVKLGRHLNIMVKNKEGKMVPKTIPPGKTIAVDVDILKKYPHLDSEWDGWGLIAAGEIAAEAIAAGRQHKGEPSRPVHNIAPAGARNRFLRAAAAPEDLEVLEEEFETEDPEEVVTPKKKKKKTA